MPITILLIMLCVLIGGGLVLAQVFLRHTHAYLLYLGLVFLLFGVTILLPPSVRWISFVCVAGALLLSVYESVQESRLRVRRLREEQMDRETAFGEYLEAVARKESLPE